jgi:hypothetical protein
MVVAAMSAEHPAAQGRLWLLDKLVGLWVWMKFR